MWLSIGAAANSKPHVIPEHWMRDRPESGHDSATVPACRCLLPLSCANPIERAVIVTPVIINEVEI